MIRALYTTVSGLITQEAKQDVITNNLANAATTGFKGDDLVLKKFNDVLIQNYDKMDGDKNVRNVIGKLSNGSEIDEVYTNFQQGDIQDTDSDTDFALNGTGFFTVSKNGQQYLTRDGHFHISSNGNLQTEDGNDVLGINANGTAAPINVGNGKITCDSHGNIYVDGVSKGKFSLVEVSDTKTLKKIGDNLYQGQGTQATNTSVKQKALEKSNVNIINGMIDMMTVMRTFETNQKIMQSLDDTLGKAVNDIGSIR